MKHRHHDPTQVKAHQSICMPGARNPGPSRAHAPKRRHAKSSSAIVLIVCCTIVTSVGWTVAADLEALSVAVYDAEDNDITDTMVAGGTYYLHGQLQASALYGYYNWHIQWKLDGNPIQETSQNNNASGGGYWTGATIGITINSFPFIAPSGTHTLTFVVDNRDEVSESNESNNTISRTFTASAASPEMDVQGNSVSILNGDSTPSLTDHTDFGSALVAGGTVVRTYTIRNTGSATLNLTGSPRVAVSGTHAADFVVTTQPAASVAAGGTTTFQVTFDPLAADTRTAALSIANDDSNENPYNFAIQGTGTTPPVMAAPEMGLGETAILRWSSISGHTYALHYSTNLRTGFSVLHPNILATPPMNTYTDNVSGVSMKFWKVVARAGFPGNQFANPSFEVDGDIILTFDSVTGWTHDVPGHFGSFGGDIYGSNHHTDGLCGCRIFSKTTGTFSGGDKAGIWQTVDLTGVASIMFDVKLGGSSPWIADVEAAAYIDSTKVWSSQTLGIANDQTVDVSGYLGTHSFELRIEALRAFDGSGRSSHFEFDNVRTVTQ